MLQRKGMVTRMSTERLGQPRESYKGTDDGTLSFNLPLEPKKEVPSMLLETASFTAMDQALALVFLGFTITGVILLARHILRVLKQDEDAE